MQSRRSSLGRAIGRRLAEHSKERLAVVFCALLAVSAALYWRLWTNQYYADDYLWLAIAKSIVHSPGHLFAVEPTNTEAVFRMTQRVLMALVYAAFGTRAWPYHVVSLLLHAAAATLVFRLLAELLGQARPGASRRRVWALASWGALYFATTRSHDIAVYWVAAYSSLLVTCATVLLFTAIVRHAQAPWRARELSAMLLGYLVVLYSKHTAVAFPLVVALYFSLFGKDASGRRDRRGQAILVGALTLMSLAELVLSKSLVAGFDLLHTIAASDVGNVTLGTNVLNNLLGAVLSSVMHAYFYYPSYLFYVPFQLSALLLLAVLVFLSRICSYRRYCFLGLGWLVVMMLPAALFNYTEYAPEQLTVVRYYYMPLVGAAILFVFLLDAVLGARARRLRIAAVVLPLAAFHIWVNVPYIRKDQWRMHERGADVQRFVKTTLAAAKDLPPGSLIYAVDWGIADTWIEQIDRLYFRAGHARLLTGAAYRDLRRLGTPQSSAPRYAAVCDNSTNRFRIWKIGTGDHAGSLPP